MSRARLERAVEQLEFVRGRVKKYVADLTPKEWFWHPVEFTTHVAWQIGHLAVSEYSLCLRRVRGMKPEDQALFTDAFNDRFKLGSQPMAGADNYPSLDEINRALDAVHAQVLKELATYTDEDLDIPLEQPHPVFSTRLGAVEYSPSHELIHNGQIGLLRRMMGKPPLR